MASVTLRNVYKRYDETEVTSNISLDVDDGEFVVFVGPSGCGKSTLLRMVAGLEDITEGELFIGPDKVNDIPPKDRQVGMVFQSYALYPHMNVAENMAFGLKLAHFKKQEMDKRVQEAAEILKLENLLDRKPKDLSGGQRQRVAIGRTMVREPAVFLFDEPLSNLDAALRVQMRIEISKLHKRLNATMVYVTHDQVEAMTMADKIVALDNGCISQVGKPLELYYYPSNKFVAGFIGSPRMNFVPARVLDADSQSARVSLIGGLEVTLPVNGSRLEVGEEATLGIRPERFCDENEAAVVLRGTVQVVERLGYQTLIHTEVEGLDWVLTQRAQGTQPIDEGAPIALGIAPEACHLFASDDEACPRLSQEPCVDC